MGFSPTAVIFSTDLEQELGKLLQEFQDVVEELKSPTQSSSRAYQHVLQEAKSRTGLGDDSGVEDSDSSEWQDCGQDRVCVLFVCGAGAAVLGEAGCGPHEGSPSLVISPNNRSFTLNLHGISAHKRT